MDERADVIFRGKKDYMDEKNAKGFRPPTSQSSFFSSFPPQEQPNALPTTLARERSAAHLGTAASLWHCGGVLRRRPRTERRSRPPFCHGSTGRYIPVFVIIQFRICTWQRAEKIIGEGRERGGGTRGIFMFEATACASCGTLTQKQIFDT